MRFHLVGGREFRGWQGRERVPAAAGRHGGFFVGDHESDLRAVRQGAHDVDQFSCWHRDFTFLANVGAYRTHQFDLHVGARYRQSPLSSNQQEVGQNRQGLTPFHNADDLAQGLQESLSLNAEFHDRFLR
jgi:hypothetical protein